MTEYPNEKSYLKFLFGYWVLVINWSLVIGVWLFIFYQYPESRIWYAMNYELLYPLKNSLMDLTI